MFGSLLNPSNCYYNSREFNGRRPKDPSVVTNPMRDLGTLRYGRPSLHSALVLLFTQAHSHRQDSINIKLLPSPLKSCRYVKKIPF
jgi:hypothetical protein